jgi:Domain of unknown function (DUF4157)
MMTSRASRSHASVRRARTADGATPAPARRSGARARRRAAPPGAALAIAMSPPREAPRRGLAGNAGEAPAIVHDVLRSPGRPLERETRTSLEPVLGMDLSSVRVHTDAAAAASADAVDALAYTVGSDVVFAAGTYAPAAPAGRHLLAHELAHVAQSARGDENVLRRRVRGQSPSGAAEITRQLSTICPDASLTSNDQLVTGECSRSTTAGCECVCDTVNDPTRTYEIAMLPAAASTTSERMHDGTIRTIPDSSVKPRTILRADPEIETLDGRGSAIEFGYFLASGRPSWYAPWRILAHELCGHARLGQTYTGGTGNRPGHDVTIDTENQIAAEHGEPARGHFADPRQGEVLYNPVGARGRVVFRQVDGTHYEAP